MIYFDFLPSKQKEQERKKKHKKDHPHIILILDRKFLLGYDDDRFLVGMNIHDPLPIFPYPCLAAQWFIHSQIVNCSDFGGQTHLSILTFFLYFLDDKSIYLFFL